MDDDAVSDRVDDGAAAEPVEATVDAVTDEVAEIVAETATQDDQDKAPALSGAPIDPGSRRLAIGVDVGGSGIKAALVDLDTGELVSPRHRVPTPQPSAPAAVIASISRIVKKIEHEVIFGSDVPVRRRLPGDRHRRRHQERRQRGSGLGRLRCRPGAGARAAPARPHGQRRRRRGRRRDALRGGRRADGHGVPDHARAPAPGSALFSNGLLVPNLELGHMEIRGRDAEKRSAAAARVRRGLCWKAWAADLDEHLLAIEQLFSPQLFIIGGGVSKRADQFIPRLTVRAEVIPASAAQRRGDRRRGDGGGRGRAGIDGRVTTDHARPMAVAVTRMVIGGQPADAADGRTFEVVEPHRGAVVATSPLGGAERRRPCRRRRRQAAFDGEWGSMAASDRGRLLLRFAQVVRDHEDELAALESRQIGKPISGARWEVGQVAQRARVLRRRDDQAPRRRRSRSPAPGSTSRCASRSASSG